MHDRFLYEHGCQWLELPAQDSSQRRRDPPVEVDRDVAVRAEHLPGGGNPVNHAAHLRGGLQVAPSAASVHLDGSVASLYPSARLIGYLAGVVATDPAVHPHSVSDRSAEKFVYRDVESFARTSPTAWSSPLSALESTGPPG